jgi:hypothetical protein
VLKLRAMKVELQAEAQRPGEAAVATQQVLSEQFALALAQAVQAQLWA